MTILSDSTFKDSFQFKKVIHIIDQIIEILRKFEVNYKKKFNFSKLFTYLGIPHSEEDEVLKIILKFQDLFEDVFCEYRIIKERKNITTYLVAENKFDNGGRKKIPFSTSQVEQFNDVIYTFKFINRGKGFDIKNTEAEFLRNLNRLRSDHPYLFKSNGDGIIYPSKLGLNLGNQIISYNKSNQTIDSYTVQNYIFEVVK